IDGNTTVNDLGYGAHNIVVYSNSTSGRTYSDKVCFSNKPIAIISPENKTYTKTAIPLNFTVSQTESSNISYSLDDKENKAIDRNTILTVSTEGAHTLVIYFTDTSNNITYSDKVCFTVNIPSSPWISPQLVGAIVVAVVFFLIIGIIVAGQKLEWSKPAKKRRPHQR
ncbi:MAG: hypothetical protein U9O89_00885, partial [Thermoproteota archaeon]|nr:hypothetical protein [Thermoproteota archaeon]